ncbi:Coagulation factor X [Orchesella cincta]|uniref:Coagulation factor X n=1 Tax=Orchesella cincta TaxID=48709 RepID=A0A1D2NLH3_ORCCI|nr:Coagulation factor X [Orchesella cincta]
MRSTIGGDRDRTISYPVPNLTADETISNQHPYHLQKWLYLYMKSVNFYQFRGLADLLRFPSECRECTCGISYREERIVGGRIAEINSYPWLTALMYKGKFYCGGTLISDRYVLTAAHCVHGVPKDQITIVFGEHDRNFTEESDTEYRKIGTIIRHVGFNRANFHNDIALLRLERPMKFRRSIAPACLPIDLEDEDFADEHGLVAGWGRTQEKGRPSHILREVEVPIMSNEECKTQTRYTPREITDTMMCAGHPEGKQDACQGDSGGPLNWEDLREDSSKEGTKYVIGIVSWGQGCARASFPGVYTRITKYLEWIRQNTQDSCFCNNP